MLCIAHFIRACGWTTQIHHGVVEWCLPDSGTWRIDDRPVFCVSLVTGAISDLIGQRACLGRTAGMER